MPQNPSIGRIVRYVLPIHWRCGGEVRAAIITRAHTPCSAEIHPGMSNLSIVPDGSNDLGNGTWVGSVMYDPAGQPGTWHWPTDPAALDGSEG